ncbi:unnamed protein product [Parnassius mnemosyne]|uniref:Uncharacterized protein n=1 Tax=Parnassius mnemosyne TaxID=213953 RepID=A0AAV1KYL6_9NEOP
MDHKRKKYACTRKRKLKSNVEAMNRNRIQRSAAGSRQPLSDVSNIEINEHRLSGHDESRLLRTTLTNIESVTKPDSQDMTNKKERRKRKFDEAFPFRRISVRKRQELINVCQNHQLQIENCTEMTNDAELFCLDGRRIVSIRYFLEILGKIADHNVKSFGCRYTNLKCIGERRKGFVSKLRFKCELCNSEFDICTEDPSNTCDVNHGVVADSNPAETFNSVIAKYVGGKRINYTQRNSYQERCVAAAISFNTKRPIYTIYKRIFGEPTGKYTNSYETQKLKRKVYKRSFRKRFLRNMDDPDYGQKSQRPDMTEEDFQMSKSEFLKQMELSDQQRDDLQIHTIDQSSSQD